MVIRKRTYKKGSSKKPVQVAAPVLPEEFPQPEVALIPRELLHERIAVLQNRTTIRDDRGEEVTFEGEAKEAFVSAFKEGYPILERTLVSLFELGTFLHGVRSKLKPHKLYHAWLDYAGIPRGTAQSYVQAYERYQDKLPRFAALGIRKLLIASRLPDCADYVELHESEIASQTTEELEKRIKKLKQRKHKKTSRAGRKPSYFSVGSYRIRPSTDGNKITIEGMTKKEQKEVLEAIKKILLQEGA